MYTEAVKKTDELSTELGRFMRRWRGKEGLTIQEAAERIGVVKSTWSMLERGVRQPETETLLALERATGTPMDELARMAGFSVRSSATAAERARRVAALAEGDPRLAILVDLLPELSPEQVDTLVSLVETMRDRNRQAQAARQTNAG